MSLASHVIWQKKGRYLDYARAKWAKIANFSILNGFNHFSKSKEKEANEPSTLCKLGCNLGWVTTKFTLPEKSQWSLVSVSTRKLYRSIIHGNMTQIHCLNVLSIARKVATCIKNRPFYVLFLIAAPKTQLKSSKDKFSKKEEKNQIWHLYKF